MADLLPKNDNDREKVIAWAKEQAKVLTEAEKNENLNIHLELSESKQLSINEAALFDGGYVFIKKTFHEMGIKSICDRVSKNYDFKYNLSEIISNLVYSRILSPSSKTSSYKYMQPLIEKPSFSLHDIYKSLDILNKESDAIQALLYQKTATKEILLYCIL